MVDDHAQHAVPSVVFVYWLKMGVYKGMCRSQLLLLNFR